MTAITLPSQPSFLKKNPLVAPLLVVVIMILSLGLHLYNIQSIGNANEYYTAAVKSMLQSWSNFFFIAAEPGGSVTVDKPPLGLWIEAIFAYFLGVSGFSVSLPNILAGVFGIPVLYVLVKRYIGELAGLVSALVMALTPVFVATNRNNTMDGLLVFFLLLAAWAFVHAAETGKLRWVLLGAFIVGLGFNIKMAQALLPLPAFYALYFFASKETWLKKILNLGAATVLLVVVSLSWAVIVDLVPADSRPYIGSSTNNSVIELMLDHNGSSRLSGGGGPGGNMPDDGNPPQLGTGQARPPKQGFQPPQNQFNIPPQGPGNGGTQFSRETGEPGVLRFFTQPLSKQMSWLLPFALISLVLAAFGSCVKLPVESGIHKALILWGGWLMTCLVFFSMVSGIFHAYYAIMLAAPLGAVVGMGFAQFWKYAQEYEWAGYALSASAALTLGFQTFALTQYGEDLALPAVASVILAAALLVMPFAARWSRLAFLMVMLIIPTYWTWMTVYAGGDNNLPTAYSGSVQTFAPDDGLRARQPNDGGQPRNDQGTNAALINYLQANTQDVEYLVAVPSSHQGSGMVLETGRPVLFMGGFGGQDNVVNADDLAQMVADHRLRYVLYGNAQGGPNGSKQEIAAWLQVSCTVVDEFSNITTGRPQGGPGGTDGLNLYLCQ